MLGRMVDNTERKCLVEFHRHERSDVWSRDDVGYGVCGDAVASCPRQGIVTDGNQVS